MRKLILGLAVSLDGYIEGPNGEYDWCFTDQDYGIKEFLKRIDAIFAGRKTYELMSSIQDPFVHIKKYVFSNTLTELQKGHELISGDIKTKVSEIKNRKGKDIWLFGGASLTTSLINEQLIDELWLSVHPILLGSGKPLFSGIRERIQLKLLDSKTYSTGLISLSYKFY